MNRKSFLILKSCPHCMPTVWSLECLRRFGWISNNPFTEGSQLLIYDIAGRQLAEYLLPTGQYSIQINTANLQPASCIAVIVSKNIPIFRTKLMIAK